MGIDVLYPTDENDIDINLGLNLDIIAVHGLNGDKIRTWTEPKSQKLWLRDFLPVDLPKARIMTFGYDATAAFSNSTAGIVEHARDLLMCLMEKRERTEGMRRPLIFVGHSLGGLVIKQALIIAEEEARYKHIYNSANGIIFFGTPHQGSSLATLAATLIQFPMMLAIKPSPELLDSLRKGCATLVDLTTKFKKHHESRPYEIVSFYETQVLRPMKGLVVEKVSALLTAPGEIPIFEEQIPVNANHREMCRFSSKRDKTYKAAVRGIKRIHQGNVASEVKNEHCLVPHSVNPYFTGRNDIREKLRESLLENRYMAQRSQQRFVLYGLGGSGKTQMCLKFAQDYRESYWGIFWVDAASNETAKESFLKIGRSCQQEGGIESVKQWLSGKEHWLLIIDNADDPDLDISPWFPECTHGTILITTRNPDLQKLATAGSCKLDEMTPEDASTLLLKTAAVDNRKSDENSQSASKVVEVLGYFALAIVQAGAVIRQGLCSLDRFCDLYSKHKKELLESGRSQSSAEYQYSVYTTWEISIRKIEMMSNKHTIFALELLRLFAFMHFDGIQEIIFQRARTNFDSQSHSPQAIFDKSIFVAMMPGGWDEMIMAKAVSLLVGYSLISVDQSRRISIHPLVHEWSRDRLSEEERIRAWKTVVTVLGMSTSFGNTVFDHQHRRVLLAHIDSCIVNQEDLLFSDGPDSEEILCSARKFIMAYREGHRWRKALNLGLKDLGLQGDCLEGQRQRTLTLNNTAEDLFYLDRYGESIDIYKAVLKETSQIDDPVGTVVARVGLARNYNSLGDFQKAIEICSTTLQQFESVIGEDHLSILITMQTIAWSYNATGKPKDAVRFSEKVFEGHKRRDGEKHVSTIIAGESLADDYIDLKMFKPARTLHEQTVGLLEETVGPDHALTVVAVSKLADLPRRKSNHPLLRRRGIKARQDALDRCQAVLGETDPRTLTCLEHLSEDYLSCGALKRSKALHEELVRKSIERWGRDNENTIRAVETLRWISKFIVMRDAIYWWAPKKMLR